MEALSRVEETTPSIDPLEHRLTEDDVAHFEEFLTRISDVPSTVPFHRLPVNHAGIADREVTVYIQDFLDPTRNVPVALVIAAYVPLSCEVRGVHMSRIEECVSALARFSYATLDQFTTALAREVATRQGAAGARIDAIGAVSIDRPTPRSDRTSSDRFTLISQARWRVPDQLELRTGLSACHIAACPCTRAFSKYSQARHLLGRYSLEQVNDILDHILTFTHSQRGMATLVVDNNLQDLSHRDLYDVLDAATHLVYSLLKRPDEHYIVRKAHERPQFTEDVVRDIAATLLDRYSHRLPATCCVRIESKMMESIHTHTVHTIIEGPLKDVVA